MNTQPSTSSPTHHQARGFTLIEVLVTIAVSGILMSIAVPGFSTFVLNDRGAAQVNSLVASVNYARSTAVDRNSSAGIEVCPSTDGKTCSRSADWSHGWVVLDLSTAASPSGPTLLQAVASAGTNTLIGTGPGAQGIIYTSMGGLRGATNLVVTVCDSRGASFARDLELNPIGTPATTQRPGFQVNGTTALSCVPAA